MCLMIMRMPCKRQTDARCAERAPRRTLLTSAAAEAAVNVGGRLIDVPDYYCDDDAVGVIDMETWTQIMKRGSNVLVSVLQ